MSLNKEKYFKYFLNKSISKNSSSILNNNNSKGNVKKIKKININISDAISKGQNSSANKLIGVNGNNKDNIDNNANINELIENNSERKNLIKKNDTLSLFETKNEKTSRNANLENYSMVSEIKTNEKFEIKVINLKERNNKENNKEEIKEDTKEKISYNSSKNEKEMKLNDLLDMMSSNRKINAYIEDEKKIEEDFQENELTKRNIDSNKLENYSIISKKKIIQKKKQNQI